MLKHVVWVPPDSVQSTRSGPATHVRGREERGDLMEPVVGLGEAPVAAAATASGIEDGTDHVGVSSVRAGRVQGCGGGGGSASRSAASSMPSRCRDLGEVGVRATGLGHGLQQRLRRDPESRGRVLEARRHPAGAALARTGRFAPAVLSGPCRADSGGGGGREVVRGLHAHEAGGQVREGLGGVVVVGFGAVRAPGPRGPRRRRGPREPSRPASWLPYSAKPSKA